MANIQGVRRPKRNSERLLTEHITIRPKYEIEINSEKDISIDKLEILYNIALKNRFIKHTDFEQCKNRQEAISKLIDLTHQKIGDFDIIESDYELLITVGQELEITPHIVRIGPILSLDMRLPDSKAIRMALWIFERMGFYSMSDNVFADYTKEIYYDNLSSATTIEEKKAASMYYSQLIKKKYIASPKIPCTIKEFSDQIKLVKSAKLYEWLCKVLELVYKNVYLQAGFAIKNSEESIHESLTYVFVRDDGPQEQEIISQIRSHEEGFGMCGSKLVGNLYTPEKKVKIEDYHDKVCALINDEIIFNLCNSIKNTYQVKP
jgi:hypothetical protein